MITPPLGYGYDDLLLRPAYSTLSSRHDPDLSLRIKNLKLEVPIFSAPMDTVTGRIMAAFMRQMGGLGVLHRYCSIEDACADVSYCKKQGLVAASTGVNGDAFLRAMSMANRGLDVLVIDVAHGHSASVLAFIEEFKRASPDVLVMSANIATPDAAIDSLRAGADILRVGVGAGSACTTRLVTGVGVPQLSAIMDIRAEVGPNHILVADGGIRTSGDIVKALAAGANAVMLGGMLSRYSIAPKPGVFRGMASDEALSDYNPQYSVAPEGKAFTSDIIYNFGRHFTDLVSAIKQGLAYLGAQDVKSLQENAAWTQVTALGYGESEAHFRGTE